MNQKTSVAAFCALAICGLNAQAASQSTASVTGLTFTVLSLDPNSGVAPSFSFVTSKGSTTFSVSANDNAIGESDSASHTRAGTFSFTLDQLSQLTNAAAYASVSNDTLAVRGYASGAQTSYNASASTGSTNPYYYSTPLNISLSANSVLLIDAKVALTASATNPSACGYYYYCSGSESASASATSYLSYNYYDGGVSSNYTSNKTLSLQAYATGGTQNQNWQYDPLTGYYHWVYTTTPGVEQDKSLNDTLRSVFSNSSSTTQFANFGLSVAVNGLASTAALPGDAVGLAIAAIPEPSTYALMLQGVLLGGWLVRRQRRA